MAAKLRPDRPSCQWFSRLGACGAKGVDFAVRPASTVALFLLIGALLSAGDGTAAIEERSFQFRYEVLLPEVLEAGELSLWLPLPQSDAFQSITKLSVEAPGALTTRADSVFGNTIGYLSLPTPIGPGQKVVVVFDAVRKVQVATRRPLSDKEEVCFLAPSSKVPEDGRFDSLAGRLVYPRASRMEQAKRIYQWVLDGMEYDKSVPGWGQGDALRACDVRKGNCTDYHSLFMAVARAAGIPTRFVIGFSLPETNGGEVFGYHCWAEFHDGSRWIPVDISESDLRGEQLFDRLDPNRIVFSTGRDITLAPSPSSGPVNFFIYPMLEINGKPSNGWSTRFTFQETKGS